MTTKSGTPTRAILYARVSTDEQATSGLGLEAQITALRAQALAFGWDVVTVLVDAGISGTVTPDKRQLGEGLALLRAGRADLLAALRFDRFTRSVVDTQDLIAHATKYQWTLSTQDLGVMDLETAHGKFLAGFFGLMAQLERDKTSERTRQALQAKRLRGERLGAERLTDPATDDRIIHYRERDALTYEAIADRLNTDQVPTPNGGVKWYRSTVAQIYKSRSQTRKVNQ